MNPFSSPVFICSASALLTVIVILWRAMRREVRPEQKPTIEEIVKKILEEDDVSL